MGLHNDSPMVLVEQIGCFSCHGKNLEWKFDYSDPQLFGSDYHLITHYITGECPTCQLTKLMDMLNWEEI